jgi:hypothetical protein
LDRRTKPWRIPKLCQVKDWLLRQLPKFTQLRVLSRTRNWLTDHLPAGLLARPGEWFLASLCCLSGLTILAGGAESTSVARLLPQGVYIAWGACLVIGGAALSCGLSSYRRSPGGWIVTRVACYRLGLRLLGLASGLYAFSMLWVAQFNAVPAASITAAFSGMCGVRLLTLGTRR